MTANDRAWRTIIKKIVFQVWFRYLTERCRRLKHDSASSEGTAKAGGLGSTGRSSLGLQPRRKLSCYGQFFCQPDIFRIMVSKGPFLNFFVHSLLL
jgi:hypothetical protein